MKDSRPRIALFGGTFDPIHKGHIAMASSAMEQLQLDRVIFIPCAMSPHKSETSHPAPGRMRMEMIRIACGAHPGMDADACELEREGLSYSWQTAEDFRCRYPDAELFWMMGDDQWHALPNWSRPEHLASLVEFLVFARIHSNPIPREGYKARFLPAIHVASATEIREAIRSGKTTDDAHPWITPQVMQYIREHKLYNGAQ
jgi:nicotinate-nucleotide adenylyltransferase